MRAFILFATFALLMVSGVAATPAAAQSPSRVALVIGNDSYRTLSKLNNPRLDAGRLADLLAANGFEVVSCDGKRPGCFDVTRESLHDALDDLTRKAQGAELALVFYAGHGMQLSRPTAQSGATSNVLAPIDLEFNCADMAMSRGVAMSDVFKAMGGARQRIIIVDACRNDPFQQCPQQHRGFSPIMSFGALAPPDAESLLMVSSTTPGQVALDGIGGEHSPFARALFDWLERSPNLYFHQLLQLHVARSVIEATSKANFIQMPEMVLRGVAPEACLKGTGCSTDDRAAALQAELDQLKRERGRDQVADNFLQLRERGIGRKLSEEERRRELDELQRVVRELAARNDPRSEEALARMQAGDAEGAKKLNAETLAAREQEADDLVARANALGAEKKREAAKIARNLAALERFTHVARAAELYKKAVDLDPANASAWYLYGNAIHQAGRTDAAKAAFDQAVVKAREANEPVTAYLATLRLGDIAMAQGDIADAKQLQETAFTMAEADLKTYPGADARADPGDESGEYNLSGVHGRYGDLQRAQGNLAAAVKSYRASLDAAERMAKAEPGNVALQQNLATAHARLGHAQQDLRDLSGALANYQTAFAVSDRLAKAEPGNASLQASLATSYSDIGRVQGARKDLPAALASHQAASTIRERLAKGEPRNADRQEAWALSLREIGSVQQAQGNPSAALASYQASLAVAERLVQADPSNVGSQRDMSLAHYSLGALQAAQKNAPGALASYQASLAISERLVKIDPSNVYWQGDMARSQQRIGLTQWGQGNFPGALESFKGALVVRERLAKTASDESARGLGELNFQIGAVLYAQGNLSGALESYKTVLAIDEGRAKANAGSNSVQSSLSGSHRRVGNVLRAQGKLAEALASFRVSLAIDERLTKADPANTTWQRNLAASHGQIGAALQAQGDLAGALASYRASLAIAERLTQTDPANVTWQRDVALAHDGIGAVLQRQGDYAGALQSFKVLFDIDERQAKADPANTGLQRNVSASHSRIGSLLQTQGNLAGALESYQAALAIDERLATADPANAAWQRNLASSHARIGEVLHTQRNVAGAAESFKTALVIRERLANSEPGNAGRQVDLAWTHDRISDVRQTQGDLAGALESAKAALAIRGRIAAADPDNARRQGDLAWTHDRIAALLQTQGNIDAALESYKTALAVQERLAKAEPANTGRQRTTANAHYGVAGALQARGDKAGALASWRQALAIAETATASDEAAETKSAGKPGPRTAAGLGNVAWHALFPREFKKALAAAERAHALRPDGIWTETNRAHALMFLQRTREAKSLYLEHKGKMSSRLVWERTIAQDFDKLRKAGLVHPLMAEVEKALGVAPSPAAVQEPGRRAGK